MFSSRVCTFVPFRYGHKTHSDNNGWSCSAFFRARLFLRDFLFPVHRLGRLGIIRRRHRDTFTDDWEFFYDFIIIVVFMEFGFGRILQANRGELESQLQEFMGNKVPATQSSPFLAFNFGLEGMMPSWKQKVVSCLLSELLKFIMSRVRKGQGMFDKEMIVKSTIMIDVLVFLFPRIVQHFVLCFECPLPSCRRFKSMELINDSYRLYSIARESEENY